MGLDGVELVMALEEGFGVKIADAEAEACFTPAAVIDIIFSKLRASDHRVCVGQRAFYLLRKALTQRLGIPRSKVTLGADIRTFTAGRLEKEVWQHLKAAVQARSWPALTRPKWMVGGLWLLALSTFGVLLLLLHWAAAAMCAVLVAVVAVRITQPFRSQIPIRYSRVRKLVPFAITSDAIAWTREQVAVLVKKLVVENLGIRADQYRENAHFVNDLGMGR
jgi:acyl carrier protein